MRKPSLIVLAVLLSALLTASQSVAQAFGPGGYGPPFPAAGAAAMSYPATQPVGYVAPDPAAQEVQPAWEIDSSGCDPLAGCGPDGACSACPTGRFWGAAEYLLWWTRGRATPPLVTTSPPGTPAAEAGVIHDGPSPFRTKILFGDERVGDSAQSGGRFTIGLWLDQPKTIGLGGDFYILEGDNAGFSASSPDGADIIARPFLNIDPLAPFAITPASNLVAYTSPTGTPLSGGGVTVSSRMDILGAEAFARFLVQRGCGYRVDLVGGYHFSRIDDTLQINSVSQILDPANPFVGSIFEVKDLFDTQNEFHGGTVGLLSLFHYRCWTLRTLAKLSIGNMRETVNIRGNTVLTQPPAPPGAPFPQGLLALNTNIGRYQRDKLTLLPEVTITLGCQVSNHWDLSIGYSLMYWNHVVLAADQIDPILNVSQLTGPLIGPAHPAFQFRDTDFWAQGVNFGATCRY